MCADCGIPPVPTGLLSGKRDCVHYWHILPAYEVPYPSTLPAQCILCDAERTYPRFITPVSPDLEMLRARTVFERNQKEAYWDGPGTSPESDQRARTRQVARR